MSDVLQKSRTEADRESFTLDNNGDTARRVTDAQIHDQLEVVKTKLDAVIDAIENITVDVGDVTVSNEVEIKNDIGNPAPVLITESALPDGAATEITLGAVLAAVDQVEPKLDAILTELEQKTEPADTQNVDVISTVLAPGAATEATLIQVRDAVDQLEVYLDGVETLLSSIGTNTDGIEGLLTTIRDNADAVESLLTTINGSVDDLETLATAANALLTTIRDNADTLETLVAATNTKLDTANTHLTNLDNWNESNRAKVNPIVGQAGVQGGSGLVNALTQRVVLATDVPLPVGQPLPNTRNTGTLTVVNANVAVSTVGYGCVMATITGTWVQTLVIEGFDGANWFSISGISTNLGAIDNSFTVNNQIFIPCSGYQQVRVRCAAFTSGAASVILEASLSPHALKVYNTSASALQSVARIQDGGGSSAVVKNVAPAINDYALAVRLIPFELATFSVVAENVQIGNNKSMIAIQNTGTSRLVLREIWIINNRTSAVTGVAGDFRVHRINSYTGGTNITPTTFDTTDLLPAGITCATGATVSGESALLRKGTWSTDEWGPGTLDQEGLDHGFQNTEPFWKQAQAGKGFVIRQNEGIHVRFATNSTAGFFDLRLVFTTE